MIYAVQLSPLAIEDLIELHRWVSDETDPATASGYLDRIEERIASLSQFPDRGTPRDDLITGIRTLAFERRLLVAYMVDGSIVTVLRVINAARDLASLFTN
ncbi:MAG: type II toxin-antitoxin system RelE/ParE family toxin [Candidatus Sphingomonas colombiensis]|nr:type II toxin-antitoxin system RelE/ParE family toxin [Sphingomonas sp.]WEK43405.1 MAG: type II toxin-antitoxin system RelE/ParE family toxin [Sphingomonas sp.]